MIALVVDITCISDIYIFNSRLIYVDIGTFECSCIYQVNMYKKLTKTSGAVKA